MNLTTPRTHERPDGRAIAISGGTHVLLLVLVWALTAFRPAPVEYTPIAITLYSPPPAAAEVEVETPAPQEEELEVETPDPEPEAEIPLPDPEPEEEVSPPPDPVQDPPPEPEPEPREEEPTAAPTEEETTEETGDDINVRMEGVKRDYPQYYNNIIGQIQRCFREPSGQHRAVVKFTILRDGTATDVEVVESSGSVAMEVRALEAVECAGAGRFGPLPEDIAYDELPILFSFDSRGGD